MYVIHCHERCCLLNIIFVRLCSLLTHCSFCIYQVTWNILVFVRRIRFFYATFICCFCSTSRPGCIIYVCILYSVYMYILNTIPNTLYYTSVYCIVYSVNYTLHTAICSIQYTPYSVYCVLYSVYTVYCLV